MVTAEIYPRRLVFVDEMGVHTSLAPLYGYSAKGERVHLKIPRNRGKNTTLLASMTLLGGMGETLAVEGSTNQGVFEAYLEHALVPTLEAGQVVIMDNLSAHKPTPGWGNWSRRGVASSSLPASLLAGLQSDRGSFLSKMKEVVRRAGARTKDALLEVLGGALSAIRIQDARGYFEHAGYRSRVQLLWNVL
jgi:hypothetical protein